MTRPPDVFDNPNEAQDRMEVEANNLATLASLNPLPPTPWGSGQRPVGLSVRTIREDPFDERSPIDRFDVNLALTTLVLPHGDASPKLEWARVDVSFLVAEGYPGSAPKVKLRTKAPLFNPGVRTMGSLMRRFGRAPEGARLLSLLGDTGGMCLYQGERWDHRRWDIMLLTRQAWGLLSLDPRFLNLVNDTMDYDARAWVARHGAELELPCNPPLHLPQAQQTRPAGISTREARRLRRRKV